MFIKLRLATLFSRHKRCKKLCIDFGGWKELNNLAQSSKLLGWPRSVISIMLWISYPTNQWNIAPSKLPLTKYSSWNGCHANAVKMKETSNQIHIQYNLGKQEWAPYFPRKFLATVLRIIECMVTVNKWNATSKTCVNFWSLKYVKEHIKILTL